MVKLRQTLLPFMSKPSLDELPKPPDPSHHQNSIPPKPPPQLPTELWDHILDPLGTFALKKFRLVCLKWSAIGAQRLYSTVYLNPYESSWSRLISVSTSLHSALVKKIVWNPLELPEECLDGDIWASRYQNLLRGLKHSQRLRFHRAYARIYRDRKSFWRVLKIESISDAINDLLNCHEIVLSDDYDLETSCKDSYFRVGVQRDPDLLKKPSTWGLRPRMWHWSGKDCSSLIAVEDIFKALLGCHSITSLKIDFWATHWNEIYNRVIKYEDIRHPSSRRWIRTSLYPHINELEFRLRFCELRWLDFEESNIPSSLGYALGCTKSFPDLQELSFAPSFSEPDGYLEFIQQEYKSICDGDTAIENLFLEDLLQHGITISKLVADYALLYDLTDAILNCMYAELYPTSPPLPNLRTIRCSNATLDMRLLLNWLASHKQLPTSSISIHLLETTILYGLDLVVFFEALAQLNVSISYGHNTFHHPLDSTFAQDINIPVLECYVINGRKGGTIQQWSDDALCSPDIEHLLEPVPQFHRKAKQRFAEIMHRPDEFKQLIIDYRKKEYQSGEMIKYIYCISLDEYGNATWEWVRLRQHSGTPTDSKEQKQTTALMILELRAGYPGWYYDEWETGWEIEYRAISAMEEFIRERQAQQEIEDQELLRQYEIELLGVDLMEAETLEESCEMR